MIYKQEINDFLKDLQDYLFPVYYSNRIIKTDDITFTLSKMFNTLKVKNYTSKEFILDLKEIKEILLLDLEAFYECDPACINKDEIIITYPGFHSIMMHRIAHILYLHDVPLLPRMISELSHSSTGIDIHPGANIGHHFFIDHGTGVVIGETTVIGNYVRIYQGVTLGALSLQNAHELKNKKRHPTIKDNVIIYANASILGGNTVIGENVVIGGNVFILSSIEDNKIVVLENKNYLIKDRKGG